MCFTLKKFVINFTIKKLFKISGFLIIKIEFLFYEPYTKGKILLLVVFYFYLIFYWGNFFFLIKKKFLKEPD